MPTIERIRPYWRGYVLPALEELIHATDSDIIPEDVFHWCESGQAFFVLAPEGFVIAAVDQDPVTGHKDLLIWFAHASKLGQDCVAQHLQYFLDLAKELDCRYISTKTALEPVGVHLEGRGWKRAETEYRLAVNG